MNNFTIQEDIESVLNWLVCNKLTVEADKCELTFYGRAKPYISKVQNIPQKYKSCWKWLGEHLDKLLWFNQHIEYVVRKLKKFCGLIHSCRHLYPRKYLLLFYHSFAKPIPEYGILIYGSAAKTRLGKIESVQHRILEQFNSHKI